MAQDMFVIVTAREEADRIGATLQALSQSFPGATLWVADDGSSDATARVARAAGVQLVRSKSPIGKGAAATLAARAALNATATNPSTVVLLCDGDLGASAARLGRLVEAVRLNQADLAVAVFARRVGGGLGLALGFARWAIRRRCGLLTQAPISGQRALRASLLSELLPFAQGFGMEVGMTIDAVRAGYRVAELELDLSHRASGRTPVGFLHRAAQLVDFARAYRARR